MQKINLGVISTPKWELRFHAGIYLGSSPYHAGSVALVMNLYTGLVSPQFHVIFDEEFTTVPYLTSNTPPPNWLYLVETAQEKATEDQEKLAYDWLHPPSSSTVTKASEGV